MAYRPHSLLSARLRQYWMLFVAEGVILVLLGCVALMGILLNGAIGVDSVVFFLAVYTLFWLLGFLFLFLGFAGLAKTVAMWPARGSWYSMIWAVLAILIFATVATILKMIFYFSTLENFFYYLFAAFFLVEGMAMITYALDQRRERSQRWRWMLLGASGAGYLLVGIMVLLIPLGMLPRLLDWIRAYSPLMASITLLIGGATMIAVALAARGGSEHVARA
jgi:uncharacterized membrane protein HdeD (DUF308 family)